MSRYPSLTQEQEAKVTSLAERLQESYDSLPPQLLELQRMIPLCDEMSATSTPHNPLRQYCYCFLVSREWDLPKAFEMMQLTIAYRAEHQLDGQPIFPAAMSCKGWDQDTVRHAFGRGDNRGGDDVPRPTDQRLDRLSAGVAPHFTYGYHKWDKMGQPVLYMMIGRVDEPGLLESLKRMAKVGQTGESVLWEVVLHILSVGECLQTYQQVQYSKKELKADAADGIIRSATVVIDLKGLTYKMLWKPALDLFMNTLKEIFKYYPQCIHQILLVNSPAMVMFAYKIVRGALPPGVQKKVQIANEQDTTATMLNFVDVDCLPDFYGGSCHCEGGCIDGFDSNSKGHNNNNNNNKNAKDTASTSGKDSQAHEEAGSGTEFVSTEDIALKAGHQHRRVFPLKEGETVVWEFLSQQKHNVGFTKFYVPAAQASEMDLAKGSTSKLEPFTVSKENPTEGSDEYTAASDGVLVLVWDNKASWFTTKHLQMKVFKQ